jgi:methylenetetrahydrofolate reductase (NADPH)
MIHISDILRKENATLSFEFFPPKTKKGAIKLFDTLIELKKLSPSFVSVTYGAGGSTRKLTHDLVIKIQKELNISVVSHLTCVGATEKDIYKILESYSEAGVNNIMALRGDPPNGMKRYDFESSPFPYAANLVAFIRKHFPEMGIGVGGFPEGHPETPNRLKEMEYLKAKVDAGADYICTQLFFDNHDFYDFRERCRIYGIDVPVIPGIMPVTSEKNMERMSDLALGTRYPAGLLKSLKKAGSHGEHFRRAGLHWATEQVKDLLRRGVPGIHFYTLNKSEDVLEITKSTGIYSSKTV